MKVVDGLSVYDMAKKKSRNRQASKDSSTDDSEAPNANKCVHISKAINLTAVQKALKQKPLQGHCQDCIKDGRSTNNVEEGGTDGTLWLCLHCAHQGCGRGSPHQHALRHHQTPRSTTHCIVMNLQNWSCWCYDCDTEILTEHESVQRIVQWLQKFAKPAAGRKEPPAASDAKEASTGSSKKPGDLHIADSTNGAKVNGTSSIAGSPAVPKVKGLNNLGNTCFMNAVLQNLCQTHLLEYAMNELAKKDAKFVLPGFRHDDDEVEGQEPENHNGDVEPDDRGSGLSHLRTLTYLEPLTAPVSQFGELTSALHSFITEMNAAAKGSVINPQNLFTRVCKKAPKFKGNQQHDSHELLVSLLDGMREEEINSRKRSIIKLLNISDIASIDDERKVRLKAYGVQLKHTFVDSIFGGHVLDSIVCKECGHASQRFESFLHISLPIVESKEPDVGTRFNWDAASLTEKRITRSAKDEAVSGESSNVTSSRLSKHQHKQMKQQARKERRNKKSLRIALQPLGADTVNVDASSASADAVEKEHDDERISNSSSPGAIVGLDIDLDEMPSHEHSPAALITADITLLPGGSADDCCTLDEPAPLPLVSESNEIIKESHETSLNEYRSTDADWSSVGLSTDVKCHMATVVSLDTDDAVADAENRAVETLATNLQSLCLDTTCTDGSVPPHGNDCPSSPIADLAAETTLACNTIAEVAPTTDADVVHVQSTTSVVAHETDGRPDSPADCTDRSCSAAAAPAAANANGSIACSLSSNADKAAAAVRQSLVTLAPVACQQVHRARTLLACLERYFASEYLTGTNKWQCGSCNKHKHRESEREEACRGASGGKKESVYTDAVKKVLVFTPPAVLTLHLKRFEQIGYGARKVEGHVEFPAMLDIAPFCSSLCTGVETGQMQHQPPKILYALYGVVEHSGSMHWGHYTAYVRARCPPDSTGAFATAQKKFMQSVLVDYGQPLRTLVERMMAVFGRDEDAVTRLSPSSDGAPSADSETQPQKPGAANAMSSGGAYHGRWYYISDSSVREVTEADVIACQAYILFYERIE